MWWETSDYTLGSPLGTDYSIKMRFYATDFPTEVGAPYSATVTFTLRMIDPRCVPGFNLPTLPTNTYSYFIQEDLMDPSVIELTGALNGNCKFSLSVTVNSNPIESMMDSSGSSWIHLSPISFTADSSYPERFTLTPDGTITLIVSTSDIQLEGVYLIEVNIAHIDEFTNTSPPISISSLNFNLNLIDNPCSPDLQVPFNGILDTTVFMESTTAQIVHLPGINNGSCELSITLIVDTGLTV